MKKGGNISFVFYFYFISKLKEKTKSGIISREKAKSYLFEWRIPRQLRPVILKELVALDLLEKEGKGFFKRSSDIFRGIRSEGGAYS